MGLWDGVIAAPQTTLPIPQKEVPAASGENSPVWGSLFSSGVKSPTFSFNPVLNSSPKTAPVPQQPSLMTQAGSAITKFLSPPSQENTIPASLYDQANQAAMQHIFDNREDFGQNADSTPETTKVGTVDVAKGLGQGLARVPAEFAITAGQAGLSLSDMAEGSNNLIKTDKGVPTTGMEWLFGDQPIKGYASQILDFADTIRNSPFAQATGLDKHALPLAFAGVVSGQALNFEGAGGEEGALSALAKTSDIGETTKILRQIGVSDDLLPDVAPRIAQMQDPAAIKDALQMVDTLQKTTKVTQAISTHQDDVSSAIAKSKSPEEISSILQTTGVDKNQIPQLSHVLVGVTNPKKVRNLIEGFQAPETELPSKSETPAESPTVPKVSVSEGNPVFDKTSQGEPTSAIQKPQIQDKVPFSASRETAPEPVKSPVSPETANKVKLNVNGATVQERVRNAIGKSEALATQITNKGQEAYIAGRDLSDSDLSTIRDEYQAGKKSIENIAKDTSDPAKALTFLQKMEDYYDYQLAADRASGGATPRVQNYLPQYWDLAKPEDKAKFDDLAKQRGLQTYFGYRNQPKIFKSYAEGIAAGFTPLRSNILEDLKAHYENASHVISRQALKTGLKEAAPDMVGMSGYGTTEKGKPFVNSNIPGLEGIAYHPKVAGLLKGYEALKPDFINLVKEKGAQAALEQVGVATQIEKFVHMLKTVPESAEEAGMTGVAASIYDHVSQPMKQLLWNWSGFHSLNITLSHIGASTLHPITGAKGVLQSVGSAMSERLYNATLDSYKTLMAAKDADGNPQSVFDWAVQSGAFEPRSLPVKPLSVEQFHPFKGGQRAIFDREIPVLQLNLAEQAARKGIVADSPEGLAVGKEIRTLTGEINKKTMNINPNTAKVASRFFLAPGFTYSKYKTLLDAFTKWGGENGAAGNLARTAVIGKSAVIGTAATLGTLLATGKFPNLQQLLANYTYNPSIQTNLLNPKGQNLDITFPKTYVSEATGALYNPSNPLNPIPTVEQYGEARLNPFLSDILKIGSNKDYYGNPIVDPDVKESALEQTGKNIGIGHLPIGAQAVIKALQGKWSKTQAGIAMGGLNTKVSASDPTSIKYAGIDNAVAQIAAIAPDDPDRLEKMQTIFNSVPPEDRQSLQYQELMSGVSTKGIYTSPTEQKYFQVQDLLAKGDTAGAAAITKAMTPQEYSTYKSIKTRIAHTTTFQQVKDLMSKGDTKGAAALTGAMNKSEYSSYLTWKKNNP